MDSFEEEVKYFTDLIFNNIQNAKTKKKGKFEAVFFNVNVRLDGQEVAIYNQEQDMFYNIFTKDIENYNFKQYLTKYLALYYIDKLAKYSNKQITFEQLAGMQKETKPIVKSILIQKNNVSEQLKLLRKYRNISEVQEYINCLYTDTYASDYIKYLIDRYYYNKKHLVKPKKNGLEKTHKILLR